MKKIKKVIEKNVKVIVVVMVMLVVGLLATGGVYAATVLSGKDIFYDPASSKLEASNMQDAIDEIYESSRIGNKGNVVEAYKYSQSASTPCVNGNEEYCERTDCYKTDAVDGSGQTISCPTGTIIYYKVNNSTVVPFHVISDNGNTLTMQAQKNIAYNTSWISIDDYENGNTDNTACNYSACTDEGPVTAFDALDRATAGWYNVNTVSTSYACSSDNCTQCHSNGCYTDAYNMTRSSRYARLISIQELYSLGCSMYNSNNCPLWVWNYLNESYYNSNDSTGTNDAISANYTNIYGSSYNNKGYWTMNAANGYMGMYVNTDGILNYANAETPLAGVRPVVTINKE